MSPLTHKIEEFLKQRLARLGYQIQRLHPAAVRISASGLSRLTSNVYLQDDGTSLFAVLREASALDVPAMRDGPINFVHVVNPYGVAHSIPEQQVAFASMRQARACYECRSGADTGGTVTFVAAAFEEDQAFASAEFGEVTLLHRSALDLAKFEVPRKLPLLFDVVAAGRALAQPGDFVVYTNSDICLAPSFYAAVAVLLRSGFDAMTINRRTVEPYPLDPALLPVMTASMGTRHPGFDCFVFPADWFDSFVPIQVVTGIPGVARGLLYNLLAHATKMVMLNSVHLTFHIGNDRPWNDPRLADYREFTVRETRSIYQRLSGVQKERLHAFCGAYGEPAVYSGIAC